MLGRLTTAFGPVVVGAAALMVAAAGLDWLWLYANTARLRQVVEQGVDGASGAPVSRLPAAAAVGVRSALAGEGYLVSTASIEVAEAIEDHGLRVHTSVPFVPIVGLWAMPGTISADVLVTR